LIAFLVTAWMLICIFLVVSTFGEWREAVQNELEAERSDPDNIELNYMAGVIRKMRYYDFMTAVTWMSTGVVAVIPGDFSTVVYEKTGIPLVSVLLVVAAVFFMLRVIAGRHARKAFMERV
jgi:hypothetical protein